MTALGRKNRKVIESEAPVFSSRYHGVPTIGATVDTGFVDKSLTGDGRGFSPQPPIEKSNALPLCYIVGG